MPSPRDECADLVGFPALCRFTAWEMALLLGGSHPSLFLSHMNIYLVLCGHGGGQLPEPHWEEQLPGKESWPMAWRVSTVLWLRTQHCVP